MKKVLKIEVFDTPKAFEQWQEKNLRNIKIHEVKLMTEGGEAQGTYNGREDKRYDHLSVTGKGVSNWTYLHKVMVLYWLLTDEEAEKEERYLALEEKRKERESRLTSRRLDLLEADMALREKKLKRKHDKEDGKNKS